MTSAIDPTKPEAGEALTQDVRDNFSAAHDEIEALQLNVPLTGSVVMWALDTEPPSYKLCNGQAINRTTFAALFAALGVTYGNGDGSTTFNVPDYRGQFIRGRDAGAGADPDAAGRTDRGDGTTGDAVGTQQPGGNESHQHANAGDHGHAAAGDHTHDTIADHQHASAGDHGHTTAGAHQHPATGDHFHELNRFESGSAGATYVQTDDDDSASPSVLDTKMSTEGDHQHASAGGHVHPNAGAHQHPATGGHLHTADGDHTHANAGDHQHAAAGGNESRAVNVNVNFIIKT
jgi:microcystin-dependent protein